MSEKHGAELGSEAWVKAVRSSRASGLVLNMVAMAVVGCFLQAWGVV